MSDLRQPSDTVIDSGVVALSGAWTPVVDVNGGNADTVTARPLGRGVSLAGVVGAGGALTGLRVSGTVGGVTRVIAADADFSSLSSAGVALVLWDTVNAAAGPHVSVANGTFVIVVPPGFNSLLVEAKGAGTTLRITGMVL